MNKRDFVKTGMLGFIGLMAAPSILKGANRLASKAVRKFHLPKLPYATNALEPFMEEETVKMKYFGHHKALTDNLNRVVQQQNLEVPIVREILKNASEYDTKITRNGAEYLNHKIFWKTLSPSGGKIDGKIAEAIQTDFGSFEKFKEDFTRAANQINETGWVWLVKKDNKLKIVTTNSYQNPFLSTMPSGSRGFPVLCLSILEPSYYSKYQGGKTEYVNKYWNFVNWDKVNLRFNRSFS